MPCEFLDRFRETRTFLRTCNGCHVSTFPGWDVTFNHLIPQFQPPATTPQPPNYSQMISLHSIFIGYKNTSIQHSKKRPIRRQRLTIQTPRRLTLEIPRDSTLFDHHKIPTKLPPTASLVPPNRPFTTLYEPKLVSSPFTKNLRTPLPTQFIESSPLS